jgi:hypothetical protein
VVQACHAAIEAARSFLPSGAAHPLVIVCAVRDESALFGCLDRVARLGVRHRAFREPDTGGQLTAVATEPVSGERRRWFRKYRLLGQPA